MISVNGAAAHKAGPGHRIIICCYAAMTEQDAAAFKPNLVYCNEANAVIGLGDQIPVQPA